MDFIINGATYAAAKIPAMQQLHIVRRMLPLIAGVPSGQLRTVQGLQATAEADLLPSLMAGLGRLSDADSEYILFGLLSGIRRKETGGVGYAPVVVDGRLMYQNLTLPDMMQLAVKSFMFNLQDFSAALPQVSPSATPTQNAP